MDARPVVWEASNLRHQVDDHPERNLTRDDIEEAMNDANRIESAEIRAGVQYHAVVGATLKGRLVVAGWSTQTATTSRPFNVAPTTAWYWTPARISADSIRFASFIASSMSSRVRFRSGWSSTWWRRFDASQTTGRASIDH